MSIDSQELIATFERLPEAKRVEVIDFARFLLAQQDDARWEQLLDHPAPRPKLDAFLKASRAQDSEPLSPDRL